MYLEGIWNGQVESKLHLQAKWEGPVESQWRLEASLQAKWSVQVAYAGQLQGPSGVQRGPVAGSQDLPHSVHV